MALTIRDEQIIRLLLSSFTEPSDNSGYATGGSNNTVIDTSKDWPINFWAGATVEVLAQNFMGNWMKYVRTCISNTATRLTIQPLPSVPLTVVVISGNRYNIKQAYNSIRWGRSIRPAWVHAAETTAPGAGAVLVTQTVGVGKTGYVYGFSISTQEANNFLLNWVSATLARSQRIIFGGPGTTEVTDLIALNEGLPADAASIISITNVNAAAVGKIYQCRLLYGEV